MLQQSPVSTMSVLLEDVSLAVHAQAERVCVALILVVDIQKSLFSHLQKASVHLLNLNSQNNSSFEFFFPHISPYIPSQPCNPYISLCMQGAEQVLLPLHCKYGNHFHQGAENHNRFSGVWGQQAKADSSRICRPLAP